jgi:hypothetical protein
MNVKELVHNLSPLPTRAPSSIIQTASARGVRKLAISTGTCLILFLYQTSCKALRLLYVYVWKRIPYRNRPLAPNRV